MSKIDIILGAAIRLSSNIQESELSDEVKQEALRDLEALLVKIELGAK